MEIKIRKQFPWHKMVTKKSQQAMAMFGVDIDRLKNNQPCHKCDIKISKGDVVYITGASGSGKSVLFRELFKYFTEVLKINAINMEEAAVADNKTVIDCIDADLIDSLRFLSKAGLSDIFNILNCPAVLSEGQKYRFKLACSIAADSDAVFADEFCSNLDRLTAATVAYKVARFARSYNKTLILASSHDDIIADISPDIVVIKYSSMPAKVIYKNQS